MKKGRINGIAIRKKVENNVYHRKSGIDFIDDSIGGFRNSGLVAILGEADIGKSMFLEQLIFSFAKQGEKVGYFALEFDDETLVEKLDIRLDSGDIDEETLDRVYFSTTSMLENVNHDRVLQEMKEMEKEDGIKIFGIDSTMMFVMGAHDEKAVLNDALRKFSEFAINTKSLIFIITQSNKSDSKEKRSSIYGSQLAYHIMNMVFFLSKKDGKTFLSVEKNKKGKEKPEIEVELNFDTLNFEAVRTKNKKQQKINESKKDDETTKTDIIKDRYEEYLREIPEMILRKRN